jgi:hypothetical protein
VLGIASGGVAIGVAPLFIVLDLAASSKPVFMLSTLVSLAVTVLWIGCFGYLIKGWKDVHVKYPTIHDDIKSRASITMAFSGLSIPFWVSHT